MASVAIKTEITSADLKRMLDGGEPFRFLDVRNEDEFAHGKIEGWHSPPIVHVPYFHFMEDPEGSVARIPRDLLLVAVCAKGGSSAWVADEVLRPQGYRVANLEGGMESWARFYAVHALPEAAGELRIWQLERPGRGCLHYVIGFVGGPALVIDPPRHLTPVLELARAERLTIRYIIDTHAHADHISGGPALARATRAPYFMHPYDGIHPLDMLPAALPFAWLTPGCEFPLGDATLQAIHVPGHTLGMTALLLRDESGMFLFSGDSIFLSSISRPDLGGRGDAWAPLHYRSLNERLLSLPDDVLILPGHFSRPAECRADGIFAATLGELKRTNPELAPRSQEAFVQHILASLPVFPPQYVDIKRVNTGLLEVDEEKANELEMGRNLCALSGVESHSP